VSLTLDPGLALRRPWFLVRSQRLPFLAVGYAGIALTLATVAPMWTLLVTPLILGVPHVVADFRYLILDRPLGLQDRQVLAILLPLAIAAALSAAVSETASPMLLAPGLVAVGGAIVFARASFRARLAAAILLAACAGVLFAQPAFSLLLLVHAHNAIAVGLWLALGPRRGVLPRLAAAAAMVGGGLAIAFGALDSVPMATGGWAAPAGGFEAAGVGRTLELPGLGASRSLLLFAYGQAVHYAVWLSLVPAERSASEPSVSLRSRMGMAALAVALVLVVLVPVAGAVVPVETRGLYLKVAGFHAWLELAVAAHLALAWKR
jgi:hypothetical protein